MKKVARFVLLIVFVLGCFTFSAGVSKAATRVGGYYRSNGTYVSPYYKTTPDSTRWNNYSTRGNYNPYTGSKGYASPYKSYTPSYRSYSYPSYRSYSTPSYKSYSSRY